MSVSWNSDTPPDTMTLSGRDWVRALRRGVPLAVLIFGGLVLMLLIRLVERPLCGLHRPVSPAITMFVCRNAFRILGLSFKATGAPMSQPGIVVANHTSWLDIFALNATKRIYFVSKSEVAAWPGIGWLARATGTVFIDRDRSQASAQKTLFAKRLKAGHKLLFFPEGTSTDGLQVLPFKTTLFASLFDADLRDRLYVQPVSVVFHAPDGADPRYYGWWGDMDFGPHVLKVLATRAPGRVELRYHSPLAVRDFADRKSLARACGDIVRAGHQALRRDVLEQP
ncbi:lysophospholipid acyltransferase family protein [Epibacterium sp. Ofav1-8]|uniref:lysophospholipid acyltransferase family protein n=1 Tax=Epibacterium sp. Ofav1-8 TaxID=2917735 RepID=UPI001EF66017|nr:lysophospholipid acyltransferase family protein [Epibacterium sp. Ofav1-8]MCG7622681.1 1-acyl-sn-glycerol-3-phosphate acyltransferase [Epibacterium sp. Ofav1-8]